MSLDLETRLRRFFASAPQNVHPIATLQISHSAMPQVFHLWREPYFGQTTIETGTVDMQPVNFEVRLAGSEGNMDQAYTIMLDTADIEDTFRNAVDSIPVATKEKIKVVYREFLSDDLTAAQATATLQVESVSWAKGVANISAIAPRLSILRTGELYTAREIPMMRGFL